MSTLTALPTPTSVALAEVRRLTSSGAARSLREAADVSMSEMARDIGVEPSAISRWERGLRTPTGEPAVRYLHLLHGLRDLA